jgi:hypothetical protein
MADWVSEISQRLSDEANEPDAFGHGRLQIMPGLKELHAAQTDTVELLCATSQLQKAVHASRQHVAFWEELQRAHAQQDFKPQLAVWRASRHEEVGN